MCGMCGYVCMSVCCMYVYVYVVSMCVWFVVHIHVWYVYVCGMYGIYVCIIFVCGLWCVYVRLCMCVGSGRSGNLILIINKETSILNYSWIVSYWLDHFFKNAIRSNYYSLGDFIVFL